MLPLGLPPSLLLALVLLEVDASLVDEADGGLLDDVDGVLPPPHVPPQEYGRSSRRAGRGRGARALLSNVRVLEIPRIPFPSWREAHRNQD